MFRIAALLAGIVSVGLVVWFLGWLVVSINRAPLWVVIGAAIGMLLFDFYQSMKQEGSDNQANGG